MCQQSCMHVVFAAFGSLEGLSLSSLLDILVDVVSAFFSCDEKRNDEKFSSHRRARATILIGRDLPSNESISPDLPTFRNGIRDSIFLLLLSCRLPSSL